MFLEYDNRALVPWCRRWVLGGMFAFFIVGSFLPIWTVWSIGRRESIGRLGMLWKALGAIPANLKIATFSQVAELHLVNAVFLFVLLGIGALAGRYAFALRTHYLRESGRTGADN